MGFAILFPDGPGAAARMLWLSRHTASVCGPAPHNDFAKENATMGSRNFQSHVPPVKHPPWLPISRVRIDMRTQLLQALQQFFESSRDQFDDNDLSTPEWRQADDALERAYEACAARHAVATVMHLCAATRRYIDMAVEMSTARSYYDGRI
ncbi:MAG: hypothetical protein IPP88_04150 [Betaproteobacteria bacterium]|nr:hypothetical protein [Betaproteobacteria bacterium]